MKPALVFAIGMLLATSGFSQNVGIGTITPAFKLDVRNGSINADSVYRIGTITVLAVPGTGNLFVGKNAGRINTGSYNTFSGEQAGYSNTTGGYNSFFGLNAGYNNTTGNYNSFFGQATGNDNTTGSDNSFFGQGAGGNNTTGIYNSFFGRFAGYSNTTGDYNSFFGQTSGLLNTIGNDNSFFGRSSGFSNTYGDDNSFFGQSAGYANTTGKYNSFFGRSAGLSNIGGDNNSFFGMEAGATNTSGYGNSFFGESAGNSTTTGVSNAFFGRNAGSLNITGEHNTILGSDANVTSSALTNAVAIGHSAMVDASWKVRIGSSSILSIGGQVGWSTFSDGRFKQQVQEDVQGLTFIKKLRTVSYIVDITALNNYYSAGRSGIDNSSSLQQNTNSQSPEIVRQSGFIAQEVEQVAKELGFSFSGIDKPTNEKALYGLRYGDFVVPLVKAVQEQQVMIEQLTTIMEQQNKKIEMLVKEITLIKEKS